MNLDPVSPMRISITRHRHRLCAAISFLNDYDCVDVTIRIARIGEQVCQAESHVIHWPSLVIFEKPAFHYIRVFFNADRSFGRNPNRTVQC